MQTVDSAPDTLEPLLAGVDPVVVAAIRRALGGHLRVKASSVHDITADLRSEVMLLLVRRLREGRGESFGESIRDFPAYAATVASHVCYGYLRRCYPEWTRLRNQVRYVMTHDEELALRDAASETPACVLIGGGLADAADHSRALGGDPAVPLRVAVKAHLRRAGGTMALSDLVEAIAHTRGIRDVAPLSLAATDRERPIEPAATSPLPVTGDDVPFIRQVWAEVEELPVRQRTALLLSLRDERGDSVLPLLTSSAIASMQHIAHGLGMAIAELQAIWNELPLDDYRIAARLGATRQQVINLRKSARERLARRLGRRAVIRA